jgi:hypothetical protein
MSASPRVSSGAPRRGRAVLELVDETTAEPLNLDAVYDALTTVLVRYYRAGQLESGSQP